MSVSIRAVEAALVELYVGHVTSTIRDGWMESISVVVDTPDAELVPDELAPSINIQFLGLNEDTESATSEYRETVSENTTLPTYRRTTRLRPVVYKVRFALTTRARDAKSDRELVQLVENLTPPRGSVEVASDWYWAMRGNTRRLDKRDKDGIVYQKAWFLDVIAALTNTTYDREDRQVHEIYVELGLVKTRLKSAGSGYNRQTGWEQQPSVRPNRDDKAVPVDASGATVDAEDAEYTVDRVVAFNDTDTWYPT